MNVLPSHLVRAALGSLLAIGCVSAPRGPVQPAPYSEPSAYPARPDWSGKPPSWSKLADIEEWLAGPGPREYPEYVPTAQLELAEGRLRLAESEGKRLPPQVLDSRLRTAEAGFQDLLARKDLEPLQRQRAQRGLAAVGDLRSGSEPAPATKSKSQSAAPAPALAPAGLAILPRAEWNAATPVRSRLTPAGVPFTRITVHHSAKYSSDIGPLSSDNVGETIKDIQTVHVRDEGYGDIGYHFLIDPAGRIWQGRGLEWQGAHANGANNVGNVGICLLGDFNHEQPNPRALASLEALVDALCERHHIPRSRIYGHRQLRSTECPGDALMAWVSRYSAGASH